MTALTIAEAARRTGITAHTLRYYERIGLMAPIARAHGGHRRYSPDDLEWIDLLKRLRASGMPIRRMLEFARLARGGRGTIPRRRALLEEHRADVEARLDEMRATLEILNRKIARYNAGRRRTSR